MGRRSGSATGGSSTRVTGPVRAGSTGYGWCTPGVHAPEETGANRRQRDAGFTLSTGFSRDQAWCSYGSTPPSRTSVTGPGSFDPALRRFPGSPWHGGVECLTNVRLSPLLRRGPPLVGGCGRLSHLSGSDTRGRSIRGTFWGDGGSTVGVHPRGARPSAGRMAQAGHTGSSGCGDHLGRSSPVRGPDGTFAGPGNALRQCLWRAWRDGTLAAEWAHRRTAVPVRERLRARVIRNDHVRVDDAPSP